MKEINKTWKYTDIFFFSKLQEVCQGLKWYGAPLLLWLNLLLVSQLILSHTSLLDVFKKKKKTPVYSCLRTLSSTFAPHPSARLIYSLIYFLSVFEYCPVVRPFPVSLFNNVYPLRLPTITMQRSLVPSFWDPNYIRVTLGCPIWQP